MKTSHSLGTFGDASPFPGRFAARPAALVVLMVLVTLVTAAFAAAGVVNVNSADASTLELLPRVGPAVAARIVEHRESNGPFRAKEDLMLVRGVGEATFSLIEPYVVLEGSSTLSEKVRASAVSEER